MTTGIGCALYLDGVRVADGRPGDDEAAPTALAGLSVVWGRATTVDQPEPSSCSFAIWNRDPGTGAADTFTPGAQVQVFAEGLTYPTPTRSTFLDPSFELGTLPATAQGGRVDLSTAQANTGAQSARLTPSGPSGMSATFAPAPFVPPGTSPEAWDAIPTTDEGQTWELDVAVFAPDGVVVQVRPVLYSGPYSTAWTPLGQGAHVVGSRGWTNVPVTFTPDTAGHWVGVQVTTYPTAQPWQDVTGTWDAPEFGTAWTWQDTAAVFVDDLNVLMPEAGVATSVLVFAGRITSTTAQADESGPVLEVVCTDFTAELDNRDVGDEPWAVETMAARFNRVVGLTGMAVTTEIDPALGPVLLSWQDVDAQGATGLLRDFATSVDGVLWPAVHRTTGPYLLVEDPAARTSTKHLVWDGTWVVIAAGAAGAVTISACDILADPVAFIRDTSEISTRVAVSWLEQGVDDEGLPSPTERTELVVDEALETNWGARRIGVTTLLQAAADALAVANRLLVRTSITGWRATGLTIDDALMDTAADAATEFLLLDGTRRIGAPLTVTDLPAWAPVGGDLALYVEGGTYTFPEGGGWVLDLTVSPSHGLGTSAPWADLDPTWAWDQMEPTMTWTDLVGTAASPDLVEESS